VSPTRWHLFCRVVDNFGDAGVAWRLARQLAGGGDDVTLFIDDLAVLAQIESRVDPGRDRQAVDGAEVCAYALHASMPPADVVVAVFGSAFSQTYREAMTSLSPQPLWIDLEYLSAEAWVTEFHGLPSPDPRSSLVKHFFYPGFGDGTGGLGFEPGIAERRRAFRDDPGARLALARSLSVDVEPPARLASLFAYPSAPYIELFDAIASGTEPWTLLVPLGVGSDAITTYFGGRGEAVLVDRALTVRVHPFLSQDAYDRLLWTCDVAFVRGEDSFVRAQCAGVPFVWQPYPQAERTHDRKRAAFEHLYDAGLAGDAREARRALWRAWNEPGVDVAAAWRGWRRHDAAIAAHARLWSEALTSAVPLVDRLRAWVASRRGNLLN